MKRRDRGDAIAAEMSCPRSFWSREIVDSAAETYFDMGKEIYESVCAVIVSRSAV